MADVLFSGGPCSGQHRTVPDSTETGDRLTCGGRSYVVWDVTADHYLALLPGKKPGGTYTVSAHKAQRAWQRLVHSIVSQLPADARRSAAQRHRIRMIGRRRR